MEKAMNSSTKTKVESILYQCKEHGDVLNRELGNETAFLDGSSSPGKYLDIAINYINYFRPISSLRFANYGLLVAKKRNDTEHAAFCHILRGKAYCMIERFEYAASCFQWALEDTSLSPVWRTWINELLVRLKSISKGEIKNSEKLQKEPEPDEYIKGVLMNMGSPTDSYQNNSSMIADANSTVQSKVISLADKTRFDWSQASSTISLDIYAKNVKPENLTVNIKTTSVSIHAILMDNSCYTLNLDPLAHAIDTDASSYRLFSTKIEVILKKQIPDKKWESLTETNHDTDLKNPQINSGTTSKISDKNWDHLLNEADKEEEEPTGDAALTKLFQELYQNADDDTRRAMMKSYTESNGTSLSTNWKDVSGRKFETRPPKGMEPKKYND